MSFFFHRRFACSAEQIPTPRSKELISNPRIQNNEGQENAPETLLAKP